MRISIEVKDSAEAARIRRALQEDDVRAFCNIIGALLPLSKRAQARTMAYVGDAVNDPDALEWVPAHPGIGEGT